MSEITKIPAKMIDGIYVDSIADLKLVEPKDTEFIHIMGYHNPGDGGRTMYRRVNSVAGTYVDNGYSVILPTGGDGSTAWVWASDSPKSFMCYGGFPEMVGKVGSVNNVMVIIDVCPVDLTAALTINSNTTLLWRRSCVLGGAFTLTVNGEILRGDYEIFDADLTVQGMSRNYSAATVSNPPTAAEITTIFGDPSKKGAGWIGVIDSNGTGTLMYLITTNGTVWFQQSQTVAA